MEEIWKDIPGYEGLYQVSNLGRVKSLNTIINCKGANGIDTHLRKGRVLKQCLDSKGYYFVGLSKNSIVKFKRIHKLMMDVFVPNVNKLPCINHKDGNKLNNTLDNLEWCTYSWNTKEAFRLGLNKSATKGKYGKDISYCKPIMQFSKDGTLIKEWASATEVKHELGYQDNNIRAVCRGVRKYAHGYVWKFKKD